MPTATIRLNNRIDLDPTEFSEGLPKRPASLENKAFSLEYESGLLYLVVTDKDQRFGDAYAKVYEINDEAYVVTPRGHMSPEEDLDGSIASYLIALHAVCDAMVYRIILTAMSTSVLDTIVYLSLSLDDTKKGDTNEQVS